MEEPTTAWETVYCLRPYHPHRIHGARNPGFDRDLDGRLLDFKDGHQRRCARERQPCGQRSAPS